MKWVKDNFLFIIILVLIVIILMQRCGNGIDLANLFNNKPSADTIIKTDTTFVTITKEIPTYIPKWNTKVEHDIIFDTITKIDTTYVLGDYFATYVYNDTIKKDTITIYINDSIHKNKIKNRNVKYKLLYSTISTTNTIIQNKHEFYVGPKLVGSNKGINFFGPEVLWRTKNKQVYSLGIGIDGNLQPNLSLSTYWKIGKK